MGIAGLDLLVDDEGPYKEVNHMGWKHRMAGLTSDGTLVLSEKPKPADVERLDKELAKGKDAERALEERARALTMGRKIG